MKLGIGLYRHMLNEDNYKFAKQVGCTHIVAHLAQYYTGEKKIVQGTDDKNNYGKSTLDDPIWELKNLIALREEIEQHGLVLEAIENFSPAQWYDVLLDGPLKEKQMENLKEIIKNVGLAGIKVFGYNFSIAGVWGHQRKNLARGGADTAVFDASELAIDAPIKNGDVWNMTYNEAAEAGVIPKVTKQQLWNRLTYFLNEILPVAEKYGVTMAAHPDDPPMEELRNTARLVYQPDLYQKLIDINKSPANQLEFCMGSIQEMTDGSVYDAIETYGSQKRIAYVHFRNVIGKVPKYTEAFIDEGDIDIFKALKLFKKHNYEGVLIPDHTPLLNCEGSWYAGMAYAIGYMKAAIKMLDYK